MAIMPAVHARWATWVPAFMLGFALASCKQDNIEAPSPGPNEAWIRLHNDTGVTLTEFYVVPAPEGGTGWGDNQFGEETLRSGRTFILKGVPCPDEYDMRALGDQTGEVQLQGVSLQCGESFDWEINGFPG